MNNKTIQAVKISTLAILLSLGIGYALAWTAPTATPPGGNVSAPINTSATGQTKTGAFTVQGLLTSAGLTLFPGTSITFPPGSAGKITFADGSTLKTVPPLIQFFKAGPDTIQSGSTVVLSWQTKGTPAPPATPCTVTGVGATYANQLQSTAVTSPILTGPGSYTFNLSCVGVDGTTVQETATVNVLAPFSQTFSGGQRGAVNIPYGVTRLTFVGSGGDGGGYACCRGLGSNTEMRVTAQGGTASLWSGSYGTQLGGAGGGGAPGGASFGLVGATGGNGGGTGGNAGFFPPNGGNGQLYYGGGAGGGGAYVRKAAAIPYLSDLIIYLGGGGGGHYPLGYAAGGGGAGYSGGGAGDANSNGTTGGGGGGTYFHPGFASDPADLVPGRSILLSALGLKAPTSIYVDTGIPGAYTGSSNAGTSGTMTVSW